jgi:hypothetical protein
VKLSDLIDKRGAPGLIHHSAGEAGIRNVDEAAVLTAAETHLKGLLVEWRRQGVTERRSVRRSSTNPGSWRGSSTGRSRTTGERGRSSRVRWWCGRCRHKLGVAAESYMDGYREFLKRTPG